MPPVNHFTGFTPVNAVSLATGKVPKRSPTLLRTTSRRRRRRDSARNFSLYSEERRLLSAAKTPSDRYTTVTVRGRQTRLEKNEKRGRGKGSKENLRGVDRKSRPTKARSKAINPQRVENDRVMVLVK